MNVLDRFRLDGKTALVTGARRGIGQAMAVALAEAGADIIGVSAQMEAQGGETQKAVSALGRAFRPYRCDFSDRRAVYEMIAKKSRPSAPRSIFWSTTRARFCANPRPSTPTSTGTRSSR